MPGILAIHLDVDTAVFGIEDLNALSGQKGDAAHARQMASSHSQEVFEIRKRCTPAKQDDFKAAVEKADAACDFKVSTVVAHAADESEGAEFAAGAVDFDLEFREATDDLAEAADPVGSFAEASLKAIAEVVNDVSVKTHAGHGKEMAGPGAAIESPDSDASGDAFRHQCGGALEAMRQANLRSQHISRASRKNADRNR